MAEIIPMSDITLLFNVPITKDYNNTYFFNSLTDQISFFTTQFQKKNFPLESYQRKSRGWLRINADYKDVYNCNYLYFYNTQTRKDGVDYEVYERKIYYAFVTEVLYINDAVSEIHYEIDVLQSFLFDWEFEDVFIERESTQSDIIGEHLIDEGMPIGDYIDAHEHMMQFNGSELGVTDYVVAATVNRNYEDTTDGAHIMSAKGRIVSGCQLLVFPEIFGAGGLLEWLDNLPGEKQGSILSIFMCPEAIITSDYVGQNILSLVDRYQLTLGEGNSAYTPKNKKLLSSPFNNLLIKSSNGDSIIFDYSKLLSTDDTFTGNKIPFSLYSIFTYPVQGILLPHKRYKGDTSPISLGLPLPQLPTCTWSNDSFKAWAALNTGYVVSSMASSVIDVGVKVAAAAITAGMAGAVVGTEASGAILSSGGDTIAQFSNIGSVSETAGQAFSRSANVFGRGMARNSGGLIGDIQNIANNLLAIRNAKIAPDVFNGSPNNQLSAAYGYFGYVATQHCVRPDYAKRLDQYFTMFGYKVNRIGKPSLNNRLRFTYVKTMNMCLHGLIPQNYIEKICSVFNNGIRWWHASEIIGKYLSTEQGSEGELIDNPTY